MLALTDVTSEVFRCVECDEETGYQGTALIQMRDDSCANLVHLGPCLRNHLLSHHGWEHCYPCDGEGGWVVSGTFVPYGEGSAQLPAEWDECTDCDGIGARG